MSIGPKVANTHTSCDHAAAQRGAVTCGGAAAGARHRRAQPRSVLCCRPASERAGAAMHAVRAAGGGAGRGNETPRAWYLSLSGGAV